MGSIFVMADPRKCVGCRACMAACLVKHFVPNDVPVARLNVVDLGNGSTAPVVCRHCENAPCAAACPTSALYRDGDRVGVRIERCIGCSSCVVACPFGAVDVVDHYGASKLNDVVMGAASSTAVVKCDRCVDRAAGPACIEACTSAALSLMDQETYSARIVLKRVAAR